MENLDVWTIVSVVLGVLASIFGIFWGKAKGLIGKITTAGKELMDVGTALTESLADDKITPEEVANIKQQWAEAKAALKAILGK